MKTVRATLLMFTAVFGSLLLFLTAPGCARVAESKAETAVNNLLPSFLGPADKYTTHVRGNSVGAVMRGRLESVHIEGQNVHLQDGMTIDRLQMDFEAISLDTQAQKLTHVGSAKFAARIGTANLNRYVTVKRPTLSGLLITLGEGTATVEARPAMLARFGIDALKIPISVRGRLAPADNGTKLDFVPDGAHVSVLPIPRPVIDYLARTLNPAVDFSVLPIPIQIQSAQIRPDGVYLEGIAPPEDLLQAANKAILPTPTPGP